MGLIREAWQLNAPYSALPTHNAQSGGHPAAAAAAVEVGKPPPPTCSSWRPSAPTAAVGRAARQPARASRASSVRVSIALGGEGEEGRGLLENSVKTMQCCK